MQTISARLARQSPDESGWQIGIRPLQQVVVGDVKSLLLLLLCAVGLVLLIACANVANLLLARATVRSKEMAVRIALGASQRRIACQLLTESALLGLLGGALGALLAWGSVSAFSSLLPAGLPQFHAVRVDGSVLGFALLLSLAASLIFGLAPVLCAVRSDVQTNLRERSRAGETRSSQHARNFLAAAEVAVAVVLLFGAGLLLRSFAHLLSVSPGFATEHLIKAEISLPRYQYTKPEQWSAFANELMTRLQAHRGLQDSAVAAPLPILNNSINLPFAIAGNPPLPQGKGDTANYVSVGPRYFSVMGIPLIRGRVFSVDDTLSTPPVALISETLAKRYFPNENPLGRHLIFGFPPHGDVSREIVGVVADIHDVSLATEPGPMMYVPFGQAPFWGAEVVVRSGLRAAEVAAAIRTETHNIDPRPAGDGYRNAASGAACIGGRAPIPHAARSARRYRTAARRHWHLWRDLVFRLAPHARNRPAHGTGSDAREASSPGNRGIGEAGAIRPGRRYSCSSDIDALLVHRAIRRNAD